MIIPNINSEENPKQSLCAERSPVVVFIIGQWHGMHYPVASTSKSNIRQRFWKLFLSLIWTRVGWAAEKKWFLKLKMWTNTFGNSIWNVLLLLTDFDAAGVYFTAMLSSWPFGYRLECWLGGPSEAATARTWETEKRIMWTAEGSGGLFNPDSTGFLHTLSKHNDSWAHSCLCKRQHQGDNSVFSPFDPSMKAFAGNKNLRKRKQ